LQALTTPPEPVALELCALAEVVAVEVTSVVGLALGVVTGETTLVGVEVATGEVGDEGAGVGVGVDGTAAAKYCQ
jgi:hypothetical protein